MPRKICLVIGYGQSNERGTGVATNRINGATIDPNVPGPNVHYRSIFGQPESGLVTTGTPGSSSTSSMFSLLKEAIALETGWDVMLINRAQGGTGAVDAWVGWDAANTRLKAQGESGYDPSSYIDKLVGSVQLMASRGYEVWTITQGHQNDVAVNRPVDKIIEASVHIQQRAIAAGASKVLVGRGNRYIGGSYEAEYNPGGKIHQIADGVLASIPGAIAGADLSTNVDVNLCAKDSLPYIHLNHAGVCWAAEKWLNAIKAAKLI